MTEIIFIVVKQKTEKYTLTQNGPQSALTIWRYTRKKNTRLFSWYVKTDPVVHRQIRKLFSKMFMYLLKTAKDFIYIQKIQTYLLKFWKPQNERNRFNRKNAI